MSFSVADRLRALWTRTSPGWLALIVWLIIAIVLLIDRAEAVASLQTSDPDDALRLVQVRDLLAGQPWWDVTQHRINPLGGGGLMHWSRLIDTPLALGIGGLAPLLGQALAERITIAIWPLVVLGLVFLALVRSVDLLRDRALAVFALLLLASDYMILFQFTPARIDHHNVQILLSQLLLLLTLHQPTARRGVLAGVAAAAHIAISLEGLPSVALFAAIMALEWIITDHAAARARFAAYLATLAGSAIILQGVTRGPDALVQRWCDGLSLPYLVALVVAAVGCAGIAYVDRQRRLAMWPRIAAIGAVGAAAAASLLLVAPQCARGPFAELDPLVVEFWYSNVREGLPVWQAIDALFAFAVAPLVVGLIGTVLALRSAARTDMQRLWLIILVAQIGTTLLALLVVRAGSTAHLFALPGLAWLLIHLWTWVRSWSSAPRRVIGSLLPILAVPPIAGLALALILGPIIGKQLINNQERGAKNRCNAPAVIAALGNRPPALLFAPLDLGPAILQFSPHSVMATGHHRNAAAIRQVFTGYLRAPAAASPVIRTSGAMYLLYCDDMNEVEIYRETAGYGLADALHDGRVPAWLTPVPLPRAAGPLRLYRIAPLARALPQHGSSSN